MQNVTNDLSRVGGSSMSVPGVGGELKYAGFWLRFLAAMLDGFIVIVGSFIIGFIIGFVSNLLLAISDIFPEGYSEMLINMISVVGVWIYFSLMESSSWGATFGKRIVGIRVVDQSGNRITFARASGRHFAKYISGFFTLSIGYLMAGFTKQKQALHDKVASCLVVVGKTTNQQKDS